MTRRIMSRIQYNLPAALLVRLEQLSDKKGEPINQLITRALIQHYPELCSIPASVLESFLHPKPSDT